jgi:hypothetical protein
LSIPPAVPQAFAVLPQIIKHCWNHGHLHWPAPDSPCFYFSWLNFFCILCTLDWTWAQVCGGSMEMPPQSPIKFLATAAVSTAHAIGKKLFLKQIHQEML